MKLEELVRGIIRGQRRALAKAITLIESERDFDREQSERLLRDLWEYQSCQKVAHRIGISGTPGVGKSTFIEAFGLSLIEKGHKVAVIAVDPSSPINGGSILGDKTRMELLSRSEHAFIRPSPSRGHLGGIALRSKEVMQVLEAAGFSHIIVETVGVGQSEVAVSSMVDTFLLLMQPGGGDSLQGIKRGVLELADIIVVNKADGELLNSAKMAQREYKSALGLFRKLRDSWSVPVRLCSSMDGQKTEEYDTRVSALYEDTKAHLSYLRDNDFLLNIRQKQNEKWMWDRILFDLKNEFLRNEKVIGRYSEVLEDLKAQRISAALASQTLLKTFLESR